MGHLFRKPAINLILMIILFLHSFKNDVDIQRGKIKNRFLVENSKKGSSPKRSMVL